MPISPLMSVRRPRVVFAASGIDSAALKARFSQVGLDAEVARHEADVRRLVTSNDTYLIFLATDFGNGGATVIQENRKKTKALWIILSKAPSEHEKTKYFNFGAADLLRHPSPPAEYLDKAKSILIRYLRSNTFESSVVLPPDLITAPAAPAAPVATKVAELTEAPVPPVTMAIQPAPASALPPGPREPTVFKTAPRTPAVERLLTLAKGASTNERALQSLLRVYADDIALLSNDNVAWNNREWPAELLPSPGGQSFRGADDAIARCQNLFRESAVRLKAKRIVLLSLGDDPATPTSQTMYHTLLSSDPRSPQPNEAVPSSMFPEAFGCSLSNQPVLFNFVPDRASLSSAAPTPLWMRDTGSGEATAAVPVLGSPTPQCALLIQFSRKCDDDMVRKIQEAQSFLREPSTEYRIIDFLCRLYRRANLPVGPSKS